MKPVVDDGESSSEPRSLARLVHNAARVGQTDAEAEPRVDAPQTLHSSGTPTSRPERA